MDQKLTELFQEKQKRSGTDAGIDWDSRRDEYLSAVRSLYEQIEGMLAEPIRQKTVVTQRRAKQLTENYIGTYSAEEPGISMYYAVVHGIRTTLLNMTAVHTAVTSRATVLTITVFGVSFLSVFSHKITPANTGATSTNPKDKSSMVWVPARPLL